METSIMTGIDEAVARLAGSPRLLVAMDFDGTLAPIVERPEDARPLPAAYAALEQLSTLPNTFVALVSGRALDSLRTVASPLPSWLLVGSHGVEIALGNSDTPLHFTDAEQAAFAALRKRLEDVVNVYPGALLELKPAGLAFHTRMAEDADGAMAAMEAALGAVRAAYPSVTWFEGRGKAVREFALREATKAAGIEALRRAVDPDVTLFAGDDVTDEHALARLEPRDVGIHVGETPSIAAYQVASPEALARVLMELARQRSVARHSSN